MALKFSDKEMEVLRNIIGGVESSGSYGVFDYGCFVEAYTASSTNFIF